MADHQWTPIDDRVVEIKVPLAGGRERLGTGFVASPNRILTALHVVLGRDAMRADTGIAPPTQILVRTLGDFRRRFGDTRDVLRERGFERLKAIAQGDYLWRPATLLWPAPNSEIPRFEFAVLEAVADEAALATLRAASMPCAWPVEEVRCRGSGFAGWNRIKLADDVTITEVAPIRGRIEPATGRIQSLQSLTIDSATPPNSEDWQGLSGAALFDEWQRLLGIASTARQTAQNSGLGVSLLADIAETSEFDEFWTASGLTKPIADRPGRVAGDVAIPECPYPGLTHFTPNDAHLFFGRDRTVERLVAAVNRRSLTALVGPSGSGKSSVVLAGLAPRLHQGGKGSWQFSSFRVGADPDRNPFVALARAMAALGASTPADPHELARDLERGDRALHDMLSDCRAANPAKRILLIADQFEEVFTLIDDEARRNRFIDILLSGFPSQSGRPAATLMLTLRADFYGSALRHQPQSADRPSLSDVLQDCVENLGPMTGEELRACIEKPAKLRGVSFAPGLADTLLGEVESQAGLLPLLEFALREIWSLQTNREITYAAHWSIEGVKGALAKRAELIFDLKTDNQTDTALIEVFRRLFTRLVNAGEGQQDTRRVARRHELGDEAWELAQDLAGEDNRLVVTSASEADQEAAELAHEALIRHWPRLAQWIEDDRDFQYWLRQVRPAVQLWSVDRTDDAPLLRGRMLAQASGWLDSRRSDCSGDEIAFIEASAALRQRVDAEEETRRQTEIERQRHLAVSQSLRLAIAARSVIGTAPETALLLAGEAMRHDWNPVSDDILRETLELTQAQVVSLSTPDHPVVAAAFDPAGHIFTLSRDGHACSFAADGELSSDVRIGDDQLVGGALRPDGGAYLAVAADGTARLCTIAGETVAVLPAWKALNQSSRPMIRWSAGGHHALCVDGDAAWLWSIKDRRVSAPWDKRQRYKKILSLLHGSRSTAGADARAALDAELDHLYDEGHRTSIFDAAISPDGQMIATASQDGTVQLWGLDGHHLKTLPDAEPNYLISVAFSRPDGGRLLAGSLDRKARLWHVDGEFLAALDGHGADVAQVVFSPDGTVMATAVDGGGEHDGTIRLWHPDGRFLRELAGHTDYISSLTFSEDSRLLVSGSRDSTVRVWTVDGTCRPVLHGHADPVISVSLDPTGARLLSLGRDGEARLWRLALSSPNLLLKADGIVYAAAYWSNEALVVSSMADGATTISRATDGVTRAQVPGRSAWAPGAEQVRLAADKVWTAEPIPGANRARVRCISHNGDELISHAAFEDEGSDADDELRCLLPSPEGDAVLALRKRSARLYTLDDERAVVLDGPNCNAREEPSVDFAAFSSDRVHVVTASINGSLWLWRRTGELVRARLVDGSSARDNLFSIALSPEGWPLLTTIRGRAELWDSTLAPVATLTCRTSKVKRGLFSPDGSRLLTIGEFAIPDLRLWDPTGGLVAVVPHEAAIDPDRVAFAAAAPVFAWPTDRTLHVFDLDGRPVARLATALDQSIRVFAFDPTGTKVAIGSYGTDIQVWSLEDGGRLLTTLRGHASEINSLQFTSDGQRLLTSSSDGTVRQFVVETSELLVQAERRIARTLTKEEIDRYAVPLPLRFRPALETSRSRSLGR